MYGAPPSSESKGGLLRQEGIAADPEFREGLKILVVDYRRPAADVCARSGSVQYSQSECGLRSNAQTMRLRKQHGLGPRGTVLSADLRTSLRKSHAICPRGVPPSRLPRRMLQVNSQMSELLPGAAPRPCVRWAADGNWHEDTTRRRTKRQESVLTLGRFGNQLCRRWELRGVPTSTERFDQPAAGRHLLNSKIDRGFLV